jgi:MoaA/NifB/PqqE/SkfB family radical SAM enzyme
MTVSAPERYPQSPLKVLQERSPEEDEDLLFLFLTEDQVFLKLTRTCNNICSFCCDTVFWNGTHMDSERVRAKIREGAESGLKRLFLSGGEPTIHPDFIKFVKFGKDLGYEQIVTITNGRMFFYEEFARKSIRAGLSEVIFSLNSHDAKTHDALVGVKGAYD